jgi:hypothetical protein
MAGRMGREMPPGPDGFMTEAELTTAIAVFAGTAA